MSETGGGSAAARQAPGAARPRGFVGAIDGGIGYLVHTAMVLACLCVAVIILLGVSDILGRTLFNSPVMGTVEITEALLATTIFLGLAYALQQHQHIVVDVITQMLGRRAKYVLHLLSLLCMLAVVLLLFWQGVNSAERAWKVTEVAAGYLPVPIWIAKALSAAGLLITVLEALRQLAWVVLFRDVEAGSRRRPHVAEDADPETDRPAEA